MFNMWINKGDFCITVKIPLIFFILIVKSIYNNVL